MFTTRLGVLTAVCLFGCGSPATVAPRDLVGTWKLDHPDLQMTWQFTIEPNGARKFRLLLGPFGQGEGDWMLNGRRLTFSPLQWPAPVELSEWLFGRTSLRELEEGFSDLEVLEATPALLRIRIRLEGQSDVLRFHRQ